MMRNSWLRRQVLSCPTISHEYHKLELSRSSSRLDNELQDLCNQVKPTLLFLIETRAKLEKVEETRRKLGFDNCFCVELVGLSGGLCLFWKKEMEVEILEKCRNYFHTHYRSKQVMASWDCTFTYGNPKFNEKIFMG